MNTVLDTWYRTCMGSLTTLSVALVAVLGAAVREGAGTLSLVLLMLVGLLVVVIVALFGLADSRIKHGSRRSG